MLWIALAILILVPLLVAIWRIDNWQRDFTTNEASTSEAATDPSLRPIEFSGRAEQLAKHVEQAVTELPRWQLLDQRTEGDTTELHLTRTTPLFGFMDDIRVTIQPHADSVRLTAHSKSRLGKGDLGQNPRNLKELLGEVRRQIAR
jgi:uncharacterized protein (DUF1499 family)